MPFNLAKYHNYTIYAFTDRRTEAHECLLSFRATSILSPLMMSSLLDKQERIVRINHELHEQKIALERLKPEPNEGVIGHWEREIEEFTIRVHRLEDRLAQRRRRGR